MKQPKNSHGFTIVELLIVIVVIAILASISIVAYNGIQDRARNTAAQEMGSQLRAKIESYNGVEGKYPSPTGTTGALLAVSMSTVDEAKIETSMQSKIVAAASVSADNPIAYTPCPGTGNAVKGGTVTYWQKTTNGTYVLGSCS